MAITDLQISDTLETSAPSIKYTGNEGPQAPQQMASANDPMADANDMSMQLFGKPIHQLTPPELELFQEEMERLKNKVEAPQQSGIMQAAQGGRIGYRDGIGPNQGSPGIMSQAMTDTEVEDAFGMTVDQERAITDQQVEDAFGVSVDDAAPVKQITDEEFYMKNFSKPSTLEKDLSGKPQLERGNLIEQELQKMLKKLIAMRERGMINKNLSDEDLISTATRNVKGNYLGLAQGGRIGYAGGGIMGSNNGSMLAARTADGSRPKYGFLDRIRKLIPNEIAGVAEKAAPFVAPFNPIAAGLMSGIGGFDRHGSLGKGLKSGLMNYGLGQGARYLGGADFQGGINPLGGFTEGTTGTGALSKYFSKPTGSGGIKNLFKSNVDSVTPGNTIGKNSSDVFESIDDSYTTGKEFDIEKIAKDTKNVSGILKTIDKFAIPILLGSMGIAAATAKPQDMKEAINATRGTKLDIAGIRKEVQEALAGGEEAWAILQQKYPYVGEFPTKKAEGGRIGLYAGGQSIPSPYTMEDARKSSMQDKMGGITDVMKRADLARQGDVGQMYMAEGGLMDMGGMEKDYRNDGGFVPIGGKEKADDVPARLSRNEFVFTADAVRGAGGGDIDKGAEIMENIMVNLEQGGRMSKKSQGLGGAQEMFDVSERLGEVI